MIPFVSFFSAIALFDGEKPTSVMWVALLNYLRITYLKRARKITMPAALKCIFTFFTMFLLRKCILFSMLLQSIQEELYVQQNPKDHKHDQKVFRPNLFTSSNIKLGLFRYFTVILLFEVLQGVYQPLDEGVFGISNVFCVIIIVRIG